MNMEEAKRTFCWKISAELKLFKYQILEKSREEIWNHSFQIDAIIRIYEMLVEESEKMDMMQLQSCIATPDFLCCVYQHYVTDQFPDNRDTDLCTVFQKLLVKIENRGRD